MDIRFEFQLLYKMTELNWNSESKEIQLDAMGVEVSMEDLLKAA